MRWKFMHKTRIPENKESFSLVILTAAADDLQVRRVQ